MNHYANLPVYKASYDLVIKIHIFSKNLSRESRYTSGQNLKNLCMDLLICIYKANRLKNKVGNIETAREILEVIKIHIRVLKDLKEVSLKKFIEINEILENISKQLVGWYKKYLSSDGPEFLSVKAAKREPLPVQ